MAAILLPPRPLKRNKALNRTPLHAGRIAALRPLGAKSDRTAQTFNRWGHLGVWERLLEVAQERGVALGMAFLDGTTIRAHQKAAGAARKGGRGQSGMGARRSAARAAASARRRA